MSKTISGFLLAGLLAAGVWAVDGAVAAVLLTDNYTAAGNPNTLDLNYNIAARQAGSLATVTYTASGNCQVGNPTGGIDGGNYLLVASGGRAPLNYNFKTAMGPLTVGVYMAPNVGSNGDRSHWAGITFGTSDANKTRYVNEPQVPFGILFRGNGQIQTFSSGADITALGLGVSYWDPAAPNANHTTDLNYIQFVISDIAGTGSAFGSGGTAVRVYAGATLIHTYWSSGGGLSAAFTEGNVAFECSDIAGFDNLSISTSTAASVTPGVFSSAYLGSGNLDASVGLDAGKTFVNAVNLKGSALAINGVNFAASTAGNPTGPGWSLNGPGSIWGSTAWGAIAGALGSTIAGSLCSDFIYGGNPAVLTLAGLTAGQTYTITFYNASWEGAGNRVQNVTSASGATTVYDEDMGSSGGGYLNVLRYTFQCGVAMERLTISPQVPANTLHMYGFSTEQTFNKTWSSGADWTSAAWAPAGAPNAVGANASFASQGSPTVLNLDDNQTVGHLQFDGANAWTLSTANSKTLTLQADPGAVSVLSVPSGTHTVAAPVALNSEAVKFGAGTLVLANASGASRLTIGAGTLQFGDASAASTFNGNITNRAALVFADPTSRVYSGAISGAGTVTKAGAGTLTLLTSQVYRGNTFIGGGTLRLGGPAPAVQNGTLESPAMGANSYTYYSTLSPVQKAAFVWASINNGGTGGALLNNSTAWGYTMPYPSPSQMFSLQKDSTLAESLYFVPGKYTISWSHARRGAQVNPYYFQLNGVSQGSTFSAASAAWATVGANFVIDTAGTYSIGFLGTSLLSDSSVGIDNISLSGGVQLPSGAVVSITSAGAALDLNGNSQTLASLTGVAGTQLLLGAGTLTVGNSAANAFAGQVTGAGGVALQGSGTFDLSGTTSTYGGVTTFAGGIVNVASLGNYSQSCSLGSRASAADVPTDIGLLFRGGTLQYTGATAQSTDRAIRISTIGGATLDASGSAPGATLSFTAASSPDFYENAGARTLTLTGSNTGANTFALAITETGGSTSLTKSGVGTWVLTGNNVFTGLTTINAGTLRLGATGALKQINPVLLNGGTLDIGSSGYTLGALAVTGSSTLNLGTGSVVFLDSAAQAWTGHLTLTGTLGPTSLRFGNGPGALTPAQLRAISFGDKPVAIDANGYIYRTPQGTWFHVR